MSDEPTTPAADDEPTGEHDTGAAAQEPTAPLPEPETHHDEPDE